MRLPILFLATLMPAAASAHAGHIADAAGHNHWVAGAAIGLAIAISLWGALKGRKDDDAEDAIEEDTDTEEAPA